MTQADVAEADEADKEVEVDEAEAYEEFCRPRCCSRIMMPLKWITNANNDICRSKSPHVHDLYCAAMVEQIGAR